MRYPNLVKRFCTIPVVIDIESNETGKNGEPILVPSIHLLCNYNGKAGKLYTETNEELEYEGLVLLDGDIYPSDEIPGGTVELFERKRNIVKGQKNRNPDGTVNYTSLYVK